MSGGMFELPDWAHENPTRLLSGYPRTASGHDPKDPNHGQFSHFTYCPVCAGWVRGLPKQVEENSISIHHPLSGRRGTTYRCPFCNSDIGFDGAMA